MTVAIAGRQWAVANAFPIWDAKASQLLGLELELEYWDFGGVVSDSLYSLAWFLMAFIGTGFGIALRPLFALPVEKVYL